MAMPGAYLPRAEAGDSTTVTTTSAPASASSGLAEIPSAWDKVDLDKWVKLM